MIIYILCGMGFFWFTYSFTNALVLYHNVMIYVLLNDGKVKDKPQYRVMNLGSSLWCRNKCYVIIYVLYWTRKKWKINRKYELVNYSGIDIATYIEITTIMECQISRDIHSYNSTNCLSCPLNIVNCSYRSRSSADLDHSSHLWS